MGLGFRGSIKLVYCRSEKLGADLKTGPGAIEVGLCALANSHICLLPPNLKTRQFPKTFRLLVEVAKAEQLRRGQQELQDQREEPHSDFFDVSEWSSIVGVIQLHHSGVAQAYDWDTVPLKDRIVYMGILL